MTLTLTLGGGWRTRIRTYVRWCQVVALVRVRCVCVTFLPVLDFLVSFFVERVADGDR